jgi:hypothetical protein
MLEAGEVSEQSEQRSVTEGVSKVRAKSERSKAKCEAQRSANNEAACGMLEAVQPKE